MNSTPFSISPSRCLLALLAFVFAIAAAPRQTHAQADPIYDSSVYLLRSTQILDQRGEFSVLLRALRQLQDPDLAPLFKEMLLAEHRIMRIHGILGLAEIDPAKQVDLKLLADVKDATMQSELIGAALDSELLNVANAKQLLAWPAMELDAKVVIATHLLEKKEFNDVALLKKAADTTNLARKGIVALLLTQLGDAAGAEMLDAVDKSTEPARDGVRSLILQTAFRFKFERIAPWAAKLGKEAVAKETLALLAMRTAIRFGDQTSLASCLAQYKVVTDDADRMRLAVSLLNLAQHVDPTTFDAMAASTEPLTRQMGVTGKAVASKKNVSAEVGKLIAFGFPVANGWALGYANFHASPEDARQIFTDLILSYERGPAKNKAQRLDEVITATQFFSEKDPAGAMLVLKPILMRDATDKQLLQGILVGLIRSLKGEPHKIVADITTPFTDINANALRLLLLAKHNVALDAGQLKDLGLLVRGGGSLPETLRVQAGWVYLKQTKQTAKALEQALKR